MNKHLLVSAILAMAFYACGPVYVIHQDPPPPPAAEPIPPPPPQPEPDATYQSFYDDLSPYGQWIDNPEYGYVWLPDAGPDFKPYATNGHWVYTDDGWTWASDYPWGWAAFHYGRWFFQDGYGWMWVPGNEWAPAWVSWRDNNDYYGWAPLGPGISFEASYGGGYNPPPHYWNFVPHQYVASPQVRNYYVTETRNVTIINNTTIINYNTRNANGTYTRNAPVRNANYGRGPDPDQVGRYTGAPVRPVAIRTSNAPGEQMRDGGLSIFRPRINSAPRNNTGNVGSQPRMAPPRVQSLNNSRPVNTTIYNRDQQNQNRDQQNNRDQQQNNNGNNGGNRNGNTGFPNRNNPVENRTPAGQPNQPQPPAPNQPGRNQPRSNPPVQQQPAQQPPVQPPPAQQQPNQQQPGQRPFSRPFNRPGAQTGNQPAQPAQLPATSPANAPAGQQPAAPANNRFPSGNRNGQGQPGNPPAGQNSRPANVPPPNPVNQQNNRPPVFNRNPAPQTPAVQPRPAQRPAPPPPPPPKRDPEQKDKS